MGTPERCQAEIPALRSLSAGHEVACHFAEEVDGSREEVDGSREPAPGAAQAAPDADGA